MEIKKQDIQALMNVLKRLKKIIITIVIII